MKKIKIKLTSGDEGEVTIDIARNLIANGHAVAVESGRSKGAKPAAKAKETHEAPASS